MCKGRVTSDYGGEWWTSREAGKDELLRVVTLKEKAVG